MTIATREFTSRPRESERRTRRPMSWWDRIKFLLLLGALFGFFVGAEMADNPLLPVNEAFRIAVDKYWWILALLALEALRQAHFFVCERSSRYYLFWRDGVFASWNRKVGRFDAYNRYRVARALKWIVAIAVVWLVGARLFDTSFFRAPFDLISWVWDNVPAAFQVIIFLTFWIGFQFGLMIFFATRG